MYCCVLIELTGDGNLVPRTVASGLYIGPVEFRSASEVILPPIPASALLGPPPGFHKPVADITDALVELKLKTGDARPAAWSPLPEREKWTLGSAPEGWVIWEEAVEVKKSMTAPYETPETETSPPRKKRKSSLSLLSASEKLQMLVSEADRARKPLAELGVNNVAVMSGRRTLGPPQQILPPSGHAQRRLSC